MGRWFHAKRVIVMLPLVKRGPYSVLVTGDHAMKRGSYLYVPRPLAPIRICHGSWVAAHAIVTKGVTLGRGAIVAANSVATKNIPDFAIAAGVPARIIKQESQFEIAI